MGNKYKILWLVLAVYLITYISTYDYNRSIHKRALDNLEQDIAARQSSSTDE